MDPVPINTSHIDLPPNGSGTAYAEAPGRAPLRSAGRWVGGPRPVHHLNHRVYKSSQERNAAAHRRNPVLPLLPFRGRPEVQVHAQTVTRRGMDSRRLLQTVAVPGQTVRRPSQPLTTMSPLRESSSVGHRSTHGDDGTHDHERERVQRKQQEPPPQPLSPTSMILLLLRAEEERTQREQPEHLTQPSLPTPMILPPLLAPLGECPPPPQQLPSMPVILEDHPPPLHPSTTPLLQRPLSP